MDIGQIFLVLHLLGAFCVGLLIIATFISLIKRKIGYYKPLAINIAFSTCFQLITGSLLALSYQHSESLFSFCSKIGLYLFIVVLAEMLLFKQFMNKSLFPAKAVVSSLTLGLVFVIVTIFHL